MSDVQTELAAAEQRVAAAKVALDRAVRAHVAATAEARALDDLLRGTDRDSPGTYARRSRELAEQLAECGRLQDGIDTARQNLHEAQAAARSPRSAAWAAEEHAFAAAVDGMSSTVATAIGDLARMLSTIKKLRAASASANHARTRMRTLEDAGFGAVAESAALATYPELQHRAIQVERVVKTRLDRLTDPMLKKLLSDELRRNLEDPHAGIADFVERAVY